MPCDSGPLFQAPVGRIAQPMPASHPQPQPRANAPQTRRSGRNDLYLPPMPEMLSATRGQPAPNPSSGQPTQPPPAMAKGAGATGPVVRGQSADTPARPSAATPARGTIPPPEALGLGAAAPTADLDWGSTRARLERLGAALYRLERIPDGSHRFTLALPYPDRPTEHRHFEARAATETEAVRVALQQAEQWKAALR